MLDIIYEKYKIFEKNYNIFSDFLIIHSNLMAIVLTKKIIKLFLDSHVLIS